MPIRIYRKLHLQKLKIFKNLWYFSYFCSKHISLGGSNEYPQSIFLSKNKKNNVYPCKPQFYFIKVAFKGVNIISSSELCSGWAIVITFRPSSVRPSVNIFKRLLLWSHLANFVQISFGTSLEWGNERLLKWSRSVGQDGRHVYIKKHLKIFFSRAEDALGWIFARIIGDGRSTKIAKRIVVRWRLTFLRQGQVRFPMHLYEHHTLEWENCWEFQTTSPLNHLSQFCSNFIWSHLRVGKKRLLKLSRSVDQDGRHARIW